MTIQQCKYVLEVAKSGSFNQASRQLYIAQSSLSNSIKLLEKELGIVIFERSNNGVYLTKEGSEFVRYASQLIEQSDFIVNRYNKPILQNKLCISTQHYDFIADIFCEIIREANFDKFYFSFKETKTYEIINEVETASCDLGVIAIKDCDYEPLYRYITSKNIDFVEFVNVKPHVYVREGHPLLVGDKLNFDDLKLYPFLSYEQGSHASSFFTEEMVSSVDTPKHIVISDRATLMNILLTTDSYTVGTGIMPSVLNDKRVASVLYDGLENYHIGYLTVKDRKKSTLVEKFIAKLEQFSNKQNNL